MKENRIIFKYSPEGGRAEKPQLQPSVQDFAEKRVGSQDESAEILIDSAGTEKQKSGLSIPNWIMQERGPEGVVKWLIDTGNLEMTYLRELAGELLVLMRSQYESLPDKAFHSYGRKPWEYVAAKLTPEVLSKIDKLENPKIYGVTVSGQLLIGDGEKYVTYAILKSSYFAVRNAAKSDGLELMTPNEFKRFASSAASDMWLEAGEEGLVDNMGSCLSSSYNNNEGVVNLVSSKNPNLSEDSILHSSYGTLRVLRIPNY